MFNNKLIWLRNELSLSVKMTHWIVL